mgnify:CR=1 FL=1
MRGLYQAKLQYGVTKLSILQVRLALYPLYYHYEPDRGTLNILDNNRVLSRIDCHKIGWVWEDTIMVGVLSSLLVPKKYRTIILFVIFSTLLFVSDDSFSRLNAETMLLPVENSWIRIQNVGTDPAEIRIQFYEDDGDVVANDQCPERAKCTALQPGFGWSFFQQTLEDLTPGYQGSAFVTSDQPFVAMLARDSFLDNGRFQIGGDSSYLGNLGGNLYLPLIQNTTNFVSRIAVQNSSDLRAACVQLIFYEDVYFQHLYHQSVCLF